MMSECAGDMKMCYVSLGSNLPDGRDRIAGAIAWLHDVMEVESCSAIYTTPSVSAGDDSIYFNAVARCRTGLQLSQIESLLKRYETESGRRREPGSHSVAIDLDLVIYDGDVLRPRDAARDYFLIGFSQIGGAGQSR